MIKKVKNRAKEIKTWFGGVAWRPRACLKIEKTTISLVKDVSIRRRAGAIERTVKRKSICRKTDTC
jgi:hypothetical protein